VPLYSSATVVINVLDVNDHEPVITVVSLAGGCGDCGDNISIPPTTPLGTIVAALSVADADSGDSGTFDCTVTSQYDAFDLVQGERGSLIVKTALHFDKIDVTSMFFDLVCRDRGSPPLSTDKRITVNVVTNHAPVFSRDVYDVAVRGDTPAGDSLVRVTATDTDQGYGGRFFYELDIADNNVTSALFAINVTSGDISTRVPLNRQRELNYVFHVVATDQGIPPMTSRARVSINVTRVAMERPVFQPTAYVFNVMENLKPPISVGQVFAFDSDWPPFNTFSFEMVDSDAFVVDPDLGLIQTRIELDREMTSSVQFKIKATDAYDEKLFSVADVTVNVLDSNDNSPIILFPAPGNDTINIYGPLREDQLVGRIVARDFDTAPNALLSYTFVTSVSEESHFRVDNESGLVFVTKALSVDDMNGVTFVVQVKVTDLGNVELQSLAKLFIVARPGSALGLVRSASVVSNTGVLIIIVSVMGVVAVALIIAIVIVIRTGKDLRKVHRRYSVQAAAERDYLRRQQSKEHVTTQLPNNMAFLGRGPGPDDEDDVDNGNSQDDDGASCGDHSFDILGHGGNYVWLPSPPMSAQRDCDLYKDVYKSRHHAASPLSNHSTHSAGRVNTFVSNDRIDHDNTDDTWQSRDQSSVRPDSNLLKKGYSHVASPTGRQGRPWSPRDQLLSVSRLIYCVVYNEYCNQTAWSGQKIH
jgi:protocadherin delta 1